MKFDDRFVESLRLFNEQRIGLTLPEAEELARRIFGTQLDDIQAAERELNEEIRRHEQRMKELESEYEDYQADR